MSCIWPLLCLKSSRRPQGDREEMLVRVDRPPTSGRQSEKPGAISRGASYSDGTLTSGSQGLNLSLPVALQRESSSREQLVHYGVIAVKTIMPLGEMFGPFKASFSILLGVLERADQMYANDAEFRDLVDQMQTISTILPGCPEEEADERTKELYKITGFLNDNIIILSDEIAERMNDNGIIQADRIATAIGHAKSRLSNFIRDTQLKLQIFQTNLQIECLSPYKPPGRRAITEQGELSSSPVLGELSQPTLRARPAITYHSGESSEGVEAIATPSSQEDPIKPNVSTELVPRVQSNVQNTATALVPRPLAHGDFGGIPQHGAPPMSRTSSNHGVRTPDSIPFIDLCGEANWVPFYAALTVANLVVYLRTELFTDDDTRSRIHQKVLQVPQLFYMMSSTGYPASREAHISLFVFRNWAMFPTHPSATVERLLGSSRDWVAALAPLTTWAKDVPLSLSESHIDWVRQPDRIVTEIFFTYSSSLKGITANHPAADWGIMMEDTIINPIIADVQKLDQFLIIDPRCPANLAYQSALSHTRQMVVVAVNSVHVDQVGKTPDVHQLLRAMYYAANYTIS